MDAREMWSRRDVVILAGLVVCALSADSHALLNDENHPDLARAMQFDPELNGGDMSKADRAQAEYYYHRYLKDATESSKKAQVYAQLGALYAVSFNRQRGEEPNRVKARDYYKKVLELEPERMAPPTMWARSMLCSLDNPPGMERIKARVAFYTWLDSWDEAKIRKLWMPHRKPGTKRGPVIPDWVEDVNEPLASELRALLTKDLVEPSEEDLRGTLNALVDYKEVAILNAATDAIYLEVPEEGFSYIREHLPPEAPERKALDKIIRSSRQRMVDEEAQRILDSFYPARRPPSEGSHDANAVGARPPGVGAAAGSTVLRRFIPHVHFAKQRMIPFILDLRSGAKVGFTARDRADDSQAYEDLAKTKRGDLAWDGRFLTTPGVKLLSSREEVQKPPKYTAEKHVGAYGLPKDVRPWYTLVALDRAGVHYLIKVFRVVPDGVDIFYRQLAPGEVSAHLRVKVEK